MRSLLILPLGLLLGCTFQVSGFGSSDAGSRDLAKPIDGSPGDRPMMLDQSIDAAPDMTLPGPDLSGFDLAGFVCPSGNPPWHIGEVTEGDTSRWASSVSPAGSCSNPVTVNQDTTVFTTGLNSIRLDSSCPSTGLIYPKGSNANWDLSSFSAITLDIASDMAGFSMTSPTIFLVVDQNNYFAYAAPKNLIPSKKAFARISVKLDGSDWPRQSVGTVTLSHINYVAVAWQSTKPSYSVWLDNLAFVPGPFVDCSP